MFQHSVFVALYLGKGWTVGAGVGIHSMLLVMKTHHLSCCNVCTRELFGAFNGSFDSWKFFFKKSAAQISSEHCTLFTFLSPLLLISHGLTHKNTIQSWRNMTADECEHSLPYKWKWLICHSPSRVAFLFSFNLFSSELKEEWTL